MSELSELLDEFPERRGGRRVKIYATKREKRAANNARHKHRMLTDPQYRARILAAARLRQNRYLKRHPRDIWAVKVARYLAAWGG
jgi:hypothetical protein